MVLEGKRRAIFDSVHGLAHPSGRATARIIARSYVWSGMRSDVLRWARQCQACGASKVTKHTNPPVIPIPVPDVRFEHVHVDIVGPFTPDRGYTHLLTIIDRTTKWPEAIPIVNTTTEAVIQAFLDGWISRFGIPATVTSDRGAQFTSEAWRKSLERLGANVSVTTAYHPQSNGIVERFHRTLKNALRCAVRSSKSWSRSLPWVLIWLRSAPKMETATSTAEILYGTALRVPGICFQVDQVHQRSAREQLELARKNVAEFMPETLDLRRFKASPFVAKTLRTAKHVFVRDDRLGKPSLAPRYAGPYRVVKKDWEKQHFPPRFWQASGRGVNVTIEGGISAGRSNVTGPVAGGRCCILSCLGLSREAS